MSPLDSVFIGLQFAVLAYFVVLNLAYVVFGYLGLRLVMTSAREQSELALKDMLERDLDMPVSILVAAYNEEATIVGSVHSLLSLHYPEFEVVVVADGPTDGTVDRLVEAFALVEEPRLFRRVLPSAPVLRTFRSLRFPNLAVLEKENGGRADALNAALNIARYPLVGAVDADSLLDAEAVLRASRRFLEDETVVAVGGTVRPLNGAVMVEGRVAGMRMPSHWVERFQVLEYARAFFTGRAGWSSFGALMIISGAFGLFRRDAVIEVGGFWTGTVCEDMELVVRLHRHLRRENRPYQILFTPDPICWTEVPATMRQLRRQRNRWQRGLWETLWRHRDMLFNPRFGRLGFLALPYFWFLEGMAPIVEVGGYALLAVGAVLGILYLKFAILFIAVAIMFGTVLSQITVGIETLLLERYPRMQDRLVLFAAALLESLGFRQLLALERFVATLQVRRKRGHWGAQRRRGIPVPSIVARAAGNPGAADPDPG